MSSQFVLQHWEKYWDDPEKFDPERFINSTPKPYTYIPFFLGPRQCIGKNFALLEIKTVLCTLLSTFEFAKSPDTPWKLMSGQAFLCYSKDTSFVIKKRWLSIKLPGHEEWRLEKNSEFKLMYIRQLDGVMVQFLYALIEFLIVFLINLFREAEKQGIKWTKTTILILYLLILWDMIHNCCDPLKNMSVIMKICMQNCKISYVLTFGPSCTKFM